MVWPALRRRYSFAIAAHTSRIRAGSGGILLPHYSPYKVAETFRVLEGLYPNRIDLGIGRAPGGMPMATQALQYGKSERFMEFMDRFPEMLSDLAGFLTDSLEPDHPFSGVIATPSVSTAPELWLLGSSDYGAKLASELGAAFSFAHFINGYAVRRRYNDTLKTFGQDCWG
jgi:luciferase family oxidoreductase group 1